MQILYTKKKHTQHLKKNLILQKPPNQKNHQKKTHQTPNYS